MGEILDEFDFLIEEEEVITFEEYSNQLVESVEIFKKKSKQFPDVTYQGIKAKDLDECLECLSTDIMPWKHTVFTIDLDILKDVSKEKLTELYIPSFIEELRSKESDVINIRNYVSHICIPENVAVIAPCTFSLYYKLENVKFADNSKLIYLGERAFEYCDRLIRLDLSKCKDLDSLPNHFLAESAVEILKISSNIKYISECAFEHSNLKKVIVDKTEYTFPEFLAQLEQNNYNRFW